MSIIDVLVAESEEDYAVKYLHKEDTKLKLKVEQLNKIK
jgi:hypothetical protein